MHKKEKIFIVIALLIAVGLACFFYLYNRNLQSSMVVIRVDGEIYQQIPIDQKDKYTILIDQEDRHNEIVIQNGQVYMETANCPDQVCVHQGNIDHVADMIVCLPNRITVEIQSNETGEIDAILR